MSRHMVRLGQRAAMAAVGMAALLLAVEPAPPALAFGSSYPPPVPSVSAGGYMTCGVRAGNQVAACWGENDTEIGSGGVFPPPGVSFLEVNTGYAHACGVKLNNGVACWGSNVAGESSPPAGKFSHVVAGYLVSCGLRLDQTVTCWGTNGTGNPLGPANPATKFTQLTTGIRHQCGLRVDGTIECWGSNTYGQLNAPSGTFAFVNSGNFDVCALPAIPSVPVCWGRNAFGQDTPPAGVLFTQVSGGFAHFCGLKVNEGIRCWGSNYWSQGDAPAGKYNQVSAGTYHSCAMPKYDSHAVCWGYNGGGRAVPLFLPPKPPDGQVGVPYSYQFRLTDMSPPPTFVITGSLPPGLRLSDDGRLVGTPKLADTFNKLTVSASNGLSPVVSEQFKMVITP